MRYAEARLKERAEKKVYRIYVTDALQCIAENTQRANGGAKLKKRYADMIDWKANRIETRSASEVIANVKELLSKVGDTK